MKNITELLQQFITESKKYEFSNEELDELFKIFKEDDDFKETYEKAKNPRYSSFDDSLADFRTFLDTDVYADGEKDVHKFYILNTEDFGVSWVKLTTGKIVNLDNLWMEYKTIVNNK